MVSAGHGFFGRQLRWSFSVFALTVVIATMILGVAGGGALQAEEKEKWQSLFDGKTLEGWKTTKYGGEGEVEVSEGRLIIHAGQPMSGVTYTKDFPKTDYEITLEAARLDGIDFFCGLTFPVGDSFASFIVGGWAGSIVGISSIDGLDASENETTKIMKFNTNQWYKIRLRVTKDRLQAWIDDEQVVNQDIKGRRISTRSEVNLSKPIGFSTYGTQAGLRKIQYRKLDAK